MSDNIHSDNGTTEVNTVYYQMDVGEGLNQYGTDAQFERLLKVLEHHTHETGKVSVGYQHALTEQQAKRMGSWLVGGTDEFYYRPKG